MAKKPKKIDPQSGAALADPELAPLIGFQIVNHKGTVDMDCFDFGQNDVFEPNFALGFIAALYNFPSEFGTRKRYMLKPVYVGDMENLNLIDSER